MKNLCPHFVVIIYFASKVLDLQAASLFGIKIAYANAM